MSRSILGQRLRTSLLATATTHSMQPVNSPQKVVFFNPPSQGRALAPSTLELPSSETSIANPNTLIQMTKPSRSSRILQALFSTVTIVVGMTAIAGVTYVASSFVLAQLESQQRSQQASEFKRGQQPPGYSTPTAPSVAITAHSQDPLADGAATMQLDRAGQLAARGKFKEAIAEANQIPFSSLLYQQAQQSIHQWSEQALQREAEQRAVKQTLQAEHERNQRHLQLAQQALDRNDWSTALQEANQINVNPINYDPLLQQQRDNVIQRAKPNEHEQKAKQFLNQGELENASYEAKQLPEIIPWRAKKENILEQVKEREADKKVAKKWNTRCRTLTKDNISRCPNVDDLKGVAELLPSTNWLPKFISPGRKSKR